MIHNTIEISYKLVDNRKRSESGELFASLKHKLFKYFV